jgi:serine/threonine protein kinase
MYILLECVAEAVVEKGLRGLAEFVPGGGALFDIAKLTWEKYRERCRESKQREEIQQLAQINFEQAKEAALEVARKVGAAQVDLIPDLALYLTQMPAAIRQSLKRADDPTGATVPAGFALHGVDDVARLLPPTLPRARAGDSLPGVSGWTLIRQIGAGGFGEVWLARKAGFDSLVAAVKFCRQLESDDRTLLHESKVLDRVLALGSHPNVVALKDVHLEGDMPWLMYEYIDGGDLADLIHQWAALPVPERESKAAGALREIAGAIAHFHRLSPPIVHRDLKPANILCDKLGRLRVTDFGISGVQAQQILQNESRGATTRAGRLQSYLYGSCTPLYASPQQRDGAAPDPRDDVHALGIIAYQMLTGQMTQGGASDLADDLKEIGVSDRLIELLRRCTAAKAERRPKDAREVEAELAALLAPAGNPVVAAPVAAFPPTTGPVKVRLHYTGLWMAFDVPVVLLLDGNPVGEGSVINGFDVAFATSVGTHQVDIAAINSEIGTSIEVAFPKPGSYDVEVSYSRMWGTFSSSAEVKFLGAASDSKGTQPQVAASPPAKADAPAATGTLRLVRTTSGGWLVSFAVTIDVATAFFVTIDGVLVGEIPYGETLNLDLPAGRHALEISGGGAFFDASHDIEIRPNETLAYNVSYTWYGGIDLARA